jgi:hypothetical protein
VKNSPGTFFDRKTIAILGLLALLANFFHPIIFIIFIISLIALIVVLYKYPGKYDERLKAFLKNGATVVIALFVILSILEGYLRFVRPHFLRLDHSITGDFSDYTGRGYLDQKVFHKPADTFRILGLGDSFAVNLNERGQNYHDYLRGMLMQNGPRNLDIVNAGMECTGPGYYWHILAKYGPLFKPDLVIVGFFVGNDFSEMEFKYRFRGEYFIKERVDPFQRFLQLFNFKWWWFSQVAKRNLLLFWDRRHKRDEVEKKVIPQEANFSEKVFLNVEKEGIWIAEKKNKQRLTDLFYKNAKVLDNFKEWCRGRNIELLIVMFPDQFQVNESLRAKLMEQYGIKAESLDLSFPNKLLFDYCRKNEIRCLDLLDDFQKEAGSKELYKINDTHWNSEGNRLAAEIIFSYLQEQQLIKTK